MAPSIHSSPKSTLPSHPGPPVAPGVPEKGQVNQNGNGPSFTGAVFNSKVEFTSDSGKIER